MIFSLSPWVGTSYVGEGALVLSLILCVIPLFYTVQRPMERYVLCSLLVAFSAFFYAHISDDFSLLNVVLHSHKHKPFIYKIAGVWASHEGSMLLWCVLLSGYICIAIFFEKEAKLWQTQRTLFLLLLFGFLLFTLITNPFARLAAPVHQGMDLNPALQDISLLIHPPHLYLGTIGFALPFIQALSFIVHKVPATYGRQTLFTTMMIAFFFQTVGVILGSAWAYYELGWGGWWFFDPVENLALMPWMLSLIALHLLILLKGNATLYGWSLMACIKTFLVCLLSLTLIRAGWLNSVHAFGFDPEKGYFLGSIFLFWSGIATFFYFRFYGESFSERIKISVPFRNITVANVTFVGMLCMACGLLALYGGTFAPILGDLLHRPFSLEIEYFLYSVFPFFIITGVLIIVMFMAKKKWKRTSYPKHIAHVGFLIALIGIGFSSYFSQESETQIHKGETLNFHTYKITLHSIEKITRPNHDSLVAHITIDNKVALPEERFYHTQNTHHREASVVTLSLLHHMHFIIGDVENKGTECSLKIIYKPFINVMWAGFGMMIFGIFLALRRALKNSTHSR